MANFTYDYVFNQMTPLEVAEANIALDMVIEIQKKEMKEPRQRGRRR